VGADDAVGAAGAAAGEAHVRVRSSPSCRCSARSVRRCPRARPRRREQATPPSGVGPLPRGAPAAGGRREQPYAGPPTVRPPPESTTCSLAPPPCPARLRYGCRVARPGRARQDRWHEPRYRLSLPVNNSRGGRSMTGARDASPEVGHCCRRRP
jgi:hypothetical protein